MPVHSEPSVWLVGSEDIRFRIPFLLELRRRGFAVEMVGTEPEDAFVEHRIPYHRYAMSRTLDPLGDRRALRQLIGLFREHRPSVVHAFDTKPGMLASFAALRAGVPVRVRTVTGLAYVFSSRSLQALFLRPVYHLVQPAVSRAATLTVFQNRDDQAYYLRHRMARPGSSDFVPGSGIDVQGLERQRPSIDTLSALRHDLGLNGGPVITMVSRLVREKGVREFCAAARAVRRERPECTFLLVGPLSSEGRQAVPRCEVEGNKDVRWLGRRSDVPALLALTDVFALPSYYREGIPRSLLEAGAMGLPLISTDMPGCREVVRDGWNGRLIPPRSTKALTDAVRALLEAGPEALARMGENSRAHVEQHFALDLVTEAYARIYRRLLERAG